MITPSHVCEVAEALSANDGAIDESADRFVVMGRPDVDLIERWRDIARAIPVAPIASISALDELGDPVDLRDLDADAVGNRLRITIEKQATEGTYYFFTPKGLSTLLARPELTANARKVLVATEFAAFRTEGCRFDVWSSAVTDDDATDPVVLPGPRRIVKDLIGGQVPISLAPFLLNGPEPEASEVYLVWRDLACRQLLLSLANEVWRDEGIEKVTLNGPRTRRMASGLDVPFEPDTFAAATEACQWVYASGRDVEVRHVLLTYELAREWPEAVAWRVGFAERGPRALEAAKTSFHAHVRETSKDTLKSLSDLRKTLSEEVAKVVVQTRELLSTMWRDFFIAATAFLGRIALLIGDKTSADASPVKFLMLAAAIFLTFSLIVTLRSNSRFMRIAKESRSDWRTKLYGFLPEDDLKSLADRPLEGAEAAYHNVKFWVCVGYAVVIVALLIGAAGFPRASRASQPGVTQGQPTVPAPTASAAGRGPGPAPAPSASTSTNPPTGRPSNVQASTPSPSNQQ